MILWNGKSKKDIDTDEDNSINEEIEYDMFSVVNNIF